MGSESLILAIYPFDKLNLLYNKWNTCNLRIITKETIECGLKHDWAIFGSSQRTLWNEPINYANTSHVSIFNSIFLLLLSFSSVCSKRSLFILYYNPFKIMLFWLQGNLCYVINSCYFLETPFAKKLFKL